MCYGKQKNMGIYDEDGLKYVGKKRANLAI